MILRLRPAGFGVFFIVAAHIVSCLLTDDRSRNSVLGSQNDQDYDPSQALSKLLLAFGNSGPSYASRLTVRRPGVTAVATAVSDAEARMKAALEAEEAESDQKQTAEFTNLNSMGPATYPLAAVVGQEAIKTALLMVGVNSKIGGVVISGSRGTAKSIMARSLHKLLPPIERIKGSKYNLDPSDPSRVDSLFKEELLATGKTFADFETEIVPVPFIQMPLDVLEDRMIGAVDVEQSMKSGRPVFDPGLLASAHRGVLYVDDINLLDESITNTLLEAVSSGYVRVQREGLSVEYPFEPILVATFNPEEAELREHLMDRIGICLSADAMPLTQEERLEASDRAQEFMNDPVAFQEKYKDADEEMQTSIVFAREYLKDTKVKREQMKYLVESAIRAGVQGSRGELFAAEVARASAALNGGETVSADDLNLGVKLSIIPRGTEIQAPNPEDELMPPPPPPPPPQQEMQEDEEPQEKENEPEPPEPDEDQEDEVPEIPEEFLIDAVGVVLDPEIMQFADGNKRKGGAGKRGQVFSESSGRHVKSMMPKSGKIKKIDIRATLATAAPYQKPRKARWEAANPGESSSGKVFVVPADARAKKYVKKTGSLVIFVVDASGSMALNRMNAAKGAAIDLLVSAYQSRDKVSLITIQGDAAQVILPPTKSITMAKNRLETMPCGGGSPLADALNQAAQTGLSQQKSGDVGEVVVIVISDGRANVPLAKSQGSLKEDDPVPDKTEIKEEVLATAKRLGSLPGFKLLVLDTENKFVSTGLAKEIAKQGGGVYKPMPKDAQQGAMVSAARKGLGW